ncbi:MAG: hypothetical protein KF852_04670 [Saprospiraceae bacterium]|nr:hypothetical protein [Saprospiraceae bacterium]
MDRAFALFSKHRNGANIEDLLNRMQVPAKDFYRFPRNNAGTVRNGQEAVVKGWGNIAAITVKISAMYEVAATLRSETTALCRIEFTLLSLFLISERQTPSFFNSKALSSQNLTLPLHPFLYVFFTFVKTL